MRQKSKDPRPKVLQEVDIPFKKDDKKIQALGLPIEEMDIKELIWHFDYPFWEKEGTDEWNLTPRQLIKNPEKEPTHFKRIQLVDLSFPLQIMKYKGRWLILDGLHRLVKAYLNVQERVKVRKVPVSAIPLIKTGFWKNGF